MGTSHAPAVFGRAASAYSRRLRFSGESPANGRPGVRYPHIRRNNRLSGACARAHRLTGSRGVWMGAPPHPDARGCLGPAQAFIRRRLARRKCGRRIASHVYGRSGPPPHGI